MIQVQISIVCGFIGELCLIRVRLNDGGLMGCVCAEMTFQQNPRHLGRDVWVGHNQGRIGVSFMINVLS